MIRKYHNHKLQTNPWHREEEPHNNDETEDKKSKATSSLIPINMIKLAWRIRIIIGVTVPITSSVSLYTKVLAHNLIGNIKRALLIG